MKALLLSIVLTGSWSADEVPGELWFLEYENALVQVSWVTEVNGETVSLKGVTTRWPNAAAFPVYDELTINPPYCPPIFGWLNVYDYNITGPVTISLTKEPFGPSKQGYEIERLINIPIVAPWDVTIDSVEFEREVVGIDPDCI